MAAYCSTTFFYSFSETPINKRTQKKKKNKKKTTCLCSFLIFSFSFFYLFFVRLIFSSCKHANNQKKKEAIILQQVLGEKGKKKKRARFCWANLEECVPSDNGVVFHEHQFLVHEPLAFRGGVKESCARRAHHLNHLSDLLDLGHSVVCLCWRCGLPCFLLQSQNVSRFLFQSAATRRKERRAQMDERRSNLLEEIQFLELPTPPNVYGYCICFHLDQVKLLVATKNQVFCISSYETEFGVVRWNHIPIPLANIPRTASLLFFVLSFFFF
jgi:hypothetical protein